MATSGPPHSYCSPQVLGRLPCLRHRGAVELPRGSGRHLGITAPGIPQDPVPGEPAGAVQCPGTPGQRPRLAGRRNQPGHAARLGHPPTAPAAGPAGPAAAAAAALALPARGVPGQCPVVPRHWRPWSPPSPLGIPGRARSPPGALQMDLYLY